MGDRSALIVAVEKYGDTTIPQVRFAEADANGFSSAIKLHGYLSQQILLNAKATKGSIESHMRRTVQRLTAIDEYIFYYAGHGFSNNGHNFITCHDTDISDLDKTSISLQWFFELIEASPCKRVALFLDCCESGISTLSKKRGIYATMSEAELDDFFRGSEYRVCFSACKTSESSYPSGVLKHGIWTFHVIEALNGDAPAALENGNRLTAMSLQNHLSTSVSRTLRKTYSALEVQTPWLYGAQNHDFQLADLTEVLAARDEAKPGYYQLKRTMFRETEEIGIRLLSGFIKGRHHVSDYVSHSTLEFVESISKEEVDHRSQVVFDAIKKNLKYKRRDLSYESGRIVTPDFEYGVWCEQDDSKPEMALIVEELTNIKNSMVDDARFNLIFEDHFTHLVFVFPKELSVTDMIDAVENSGRDDIEIEYSKDTSWCELTFKDRDFVVRIRGRELTIRSDGASTPRDLIEAFFETQRLLAGTPVISLLTA